MRTDHIELATPCATVEALLERLDGRKRPSTVIKVTYGELEPLVRDHGRLARLAAELHVEVRWPKTEGTNR